LREAAVLTAFVTGVFLLVGAGGTKTADADKQHAVPIHLAIPSTTKKEATCNKWEIVKGIRFYRASTWMWQWQEGVGFSHMTKWRPKHSCEFLTYLAVRARERAHVAHQSFERWLGAMLAKWDCIHRHEASWYGDDNPTYDGGLQMDDGFEETYGSDFIRLWGHNASNWPVWAQLRAAERAFRTRGFGPWPTRHYCGL
jgi:hypothetical protein